MCAQKQKWSVENFQFSETDFSRLVQRFANHWQEGSCERMLSSPRAVRQRSENTTNPSHRIMLFERQQKDRNLQTHAQNQHTRLCRVAPVECVPSPTCAIERTGELEESVSAHPLVSANEGPRQLLSYCASRNFTGFVAWFFCSLRISRPALLVSPLCKPASHQRAPFSLSLSLSRRLTLLWFVVPSREAIWPRSMRQSSGCSPFSPPCFVL